MARRAQWEVDGMFGPIAALAWAEDWKLACAPYPGRSFGSEYNQRQAARSRMKHRYEGWKALDVAESQVLRMEKRAQAIVETCKALRAFKSKVAGLDSYGEPGA